MGDGTGSGGSSLTKDKSGYLLTSIPTTLSGEDEGTKLSGLSRSALWSCILQEKSMRHISVGPFHQRDREVLRTWQWHEKLEVAKENGVGGQVWSQAKECGTRHEPHSSPRRCCHAKGDPGTACGLRPWGSRHGWTAARGPTHTRGHRPQLLSSHRLQFLAEAQEEKEAWALNLNQSPLCFGPQLPH